jgi:hypothetical protein
VASRKYNSWVIGGGYSTAQMKRNQIRTDLAVQKRAAPSTAADNDAEHHRRAEARPVGSAVQPYKPKFAEAMREERRRQADAAFSARRGRSPVSNEQERTSKAVKVFLGEHPREAPNATSTLRQALRHEFEKPMRDASTGALFPPLLQPFGRPMHFLRGRERAAARTGIASPAFPSESPAADRSAEPFGLPQAERRRPQPQSGPQGFFPTGSSTTAYRHFTNYGQLARTSATNPEGFGLSTVSVKHA